MSSKKSNFFLAMLLKNLKKSQYENSYTYIYIYIIFLLHLTKFINLIIKVCNYVYKIRVRSI